MLVPPLEPLIRSAVERYANEAEYESGTLRGESGVTFLGNLKILFFFSSSSLSLFHDQSVPSCTSSPPTFSR